jgi:hypothetical protein
VAWEIVAWEIVAWEIVAWEIVAWEIVAWEIVAGTCSVCELMPLQYLRAMIRFASLCDIGVTW